MSFKLVPIATLLALASTTSFAAAIDLDSDADRGASAESETPVNASATAKGGNRGAGKKPGASGQHGGNNGPPANASASRPGGGTHAAAPGRSSGQGQGQRGGQGQGGQGQGAQGQNGQGQGQRGGQANAQGAPPRGQGNANANVQNRMNTGNKPGMTPRAGAMQGPNPGQRMAVSNKANTHAKSAHKSPAPHAGAPKANNKVGGHAPAVKHPKAAAPRAVHPPLHRGGPKAAVKRARLANPKHHHSVVFPRWKPTYHRYHLSSHYPHWHPGYWSHGVFIYSPPPARVGGPSASSGSSDSIRAVDRNGDFGIGIRSGSYIGSYYDGRGSFGDFGMGLAARYRPTEALGLELGWQYHDQSWSKDTERIEAPLSTSLQLFAFPWTRVSPYASLGLTWTKRNYSDTFFDGVGYDRVSVEDTLFGPHAGLGLEFAVGQSASLNLEGRYTGYVNRDADDPTTPGALQGTLGLNMYF